MKRLIWVLLSLAMLLSSGCEYEEVKRETGYKGKARVNPWLAAERFLDHKGHTVRSLGSWKNPEAGEAVCFMPASILSNEGFIGRMKLWVNEGGHLVLLVDDADAERNDWRDTAYPLERIERPLVNFLKEAALELKQDDEKSASEIEFNDSRFKVAANSKTSVKGEGGEAGVFVSREFGEGRISVMTDAKIFRSRWVSDQDHAALLNALVESSPYEGAVLFVRGSGISLWALLGRHLWPVLTGLLVMLALWLWKSFSRFGPIEAAAGSSPLRGYDHHLEALGDFQWRLDQGAALLQPLRETIIEGGQRLAAKTGRRDEDFFQLLAERAELSRERVARALTESAPADSIVLTRTAADLQRLLEVLR